MSATDVQRVSFSAPDGGWGWLVVVASFVNHLLFDGLVYSCGVFYSDFLDYFHSSRVVTSWVGSITNGCTMLSSPIVGYVVRRWGCRVSCITGATLATLGLVTSTFVSEIYVLYVTLGAITGLGFSMMHLPSVVCVGWYFDKRRSFASGLAVCGSGVGMFVMPPLCQYLLDLYGWKGAILILGGVVANGLAAGATFAPLEPMNSYTTECPTQVTVSENSVKMESNGLTEKPNEFKPPILASSFSSNFSVAFQDVSGGRNFSTEGGASASVITTQTNTARYLRVLRDPIFHIFLLHTIFSSAGNAAPYMFVPDYAKSIGINPQDAAFLISVIGIVNTVFRIVLGALADLKQVAPYRIYVFIGTLMIGGLSTVVVGFCNTYASLVVCAVFYGFSASRFAIVTQLVLDLFSMDVMVEVFVISNSLYGILSMTCTPFMGWLYDRTGSYVTSFIVSGALIGSGGFILLLLPLLKKCRRNGK